MGLTMHSQQPSEPMRKWECSHSAHIQYGPDVKGFSTNSFQSSHFPYILDPQQEVDTNRFICPLTLGSHWLESGTCTGTPFPSNLGRPQETAFLNVCTCIGIAGSPCLWPSLRLDLHQGGTTMHSWAPTTSISP